MNDIISDLLTVLAYTGVGAEPRLALPAPWFIHRALRVPDGLILFTIIGWVFS